MDGNSLAYMGWKWAPRMLSDYDDFYIASKEQAEQQLYTAEQTIKQVAAYLEMKETGDE